MTLPDPTHQREPAKGKQETSLFRHTKASFQMEAQYGIEDTQ